MIVCLACLYAVPWTPRKEFVTKFRKVEPGMTLDAVNGMLNGYVFVESRSSHRDMERFYRHAPTGRYDSDVGAVRFHDERVVTTTFAPD